MLQIVRRSSTMNLFGCPTPIAARIVGIEYLQGTIIDHYYKTGRKWHGIYRTQGDRFNRDLPTRTLHGMARNALHKVFLWEHEFPKLRAVILCPRRIPISVYIVFGPGLMSDKQNQSLTYISIMGNKSYGYQRTVLLGVLQEYHGKMKEVKTTIGVVWLHGNLPDR